MKLKIILILTLFINQYLIAQKINFKIKIEYITTINWETPKSYPSTLFINDSISYFVLKEYQESSLSKNLKEGTFKLFIGRKTKNFYLNNGDYFLCSEQIFDKHFLVKDSIPKIEWKISNETKLIKNYLCKKATANFRGRIYTAWFTEEIPINKGPWKLGGLPGLIFEVNDELNEVQFKLNSISHISKDIDISLHNNKYILWKDYITKTIQKLKAFRAFMESSNSDSNISIEFSSIKSIEKISSDEKISNN